MEEAEIEQRLDELLNQHLNTISKTLADVSQPLSSSMTKRSWDDVIKLGEELSNQATAVGMLWNGEGPDAKALEESMETYSNLLWSFLLLSHESLIGAGDTLNIDIRCSLKEVVDYSETLLTESVACYGNKSKAQRSIPPIVRDVWKACTSLKDTPRTNIAAIVDSMTSYTGIIDDVLRETKELYKPTFSGLSDEVSKPNKNTNDSDNSSEGDYSNDLSPTEMKNIELAIEVMSRTLSTIKETILPITSVFENHQTPNENTQMLASLEKIKEISAGLKTHVDDMKDDLYSPQEIPAIRTASEEMVSLVGELQEQLESISGSSVAFVRASNGLQNSLTQLQLGLR